MSSFPRPPSTKGINFEKKMEVSRVQAGAGEACGEQTPLLSPDPERSFEMVGRHPAEGMLVLQASGCEGEGVQGPRGHSLAGEGAPKKGGASAGPWPGLAPPSGCRACSESPLGRLEGEKQKENPRSLRSQEGTRARVGVHSMGAGGARADA